MIRTMISHSPAVVDIELNERISRISFYEIIIVMNAIQCVQKIDSNTSLFDEQYISQFHMLQFSVMVQRNHRIFERLIAKKKILQNLMKTIFAHQCMRTN